jgi:hypothetical protein
MEVAKVRDAKRLEELEAVIKRDLESFYEVGRALVEIREKGLYKIKNGGAYKTFKEYAKETWDMSNRHAERLIAASGVIDNLRPCGRVLPATEYHVRHLTKLTEDKQGAAWEMVLETAPDGKVTEALVYKIVKNMLPQPPPKPKFVSPPSTPESPSTGDANYFTNMAIYQLERIRDDDPLRDAAFCRLKEWMEKWVENHKPGRKLK